MNETGISVLICTYNSETRIGDTLDRLKAQKVPDGLLWEVLVVDYQSTDRTVVICENYNKDFPAPITVINETKPGKSSAMITGFTHAQGKFVCIVDDDNWVAEDYVHVAYKTMSAHDDIGIVGGFGIPYFQVTKPEWFDTFSGVYAVGPQYHTAGYLDEKEKNWFWGAGSVIRKSAWEQMLAQGFQFILNPSRDGASMFKKGFAGGEDQETCFALQLCGYRLWYEPTLIYEHFISTGRLTKNYLFKTIAGTSTAVPILKFYQSLLVPDTIKGTFKKYLYTVLPFMFVHDVYVLLVGVKSAILSPYRKIFLRTTIIRFKASINGIFLVSGKSREVLNNLTRLKAAQSLTGK